MELSVRFKPGSTCPPPSSDGESVKTQISENEHGVTFKLRCLLLKGVVIYLVVATVTRLWIPVCTTVKRRPGST